MGSGGKMEFTLSIRLRITLQLLMLIVGSNHYIAKSFARLVPYHSRCQIVQKKYVAICVTLPLANSEVVNGKFGTRIFHIVWDLGS